mgnify:CR=1 FL=1
MITEVNTARYAVGYALATIGLIAVDGPIARL